jgi:hypothetical protein
LLFSDFQDLQIFRISDFIRFRIFQYMEEIENVNLPGLGKYRISRTRSAGLLHLMSRRFAGSAGEALEMLGKMAQQAQHISGA